jgi:hypothetical protein
VAAAGAARLNHKLVDLGRGLRKASAFLTFTSRHLSSFLPICKPAQSILMDSSIFF